MDTRSIAHADKIEVHAVKTPDNLRVNSHKKADVPPNTRTVNILILIYEGWNFNSGNYLFTTDTK